MKKILQYRLHIILLAVLLTLMPFPTIDLRNSMVALAMGLVMGWVYLFNKVTDVVEDNINTPAYRIDDYDTLRKVAFACLIIPLLWLWLTPNILIVYLVFGGLLGFFYSYPIRIGKKHYRLKNLLLIKNITSAISWTGCTCLPYYFLQENPDYLYIQTQAISVFVVVLCIEIVWDIHDIEGDKQAGVRTLANTIGITPTKIILVLGLMAYCLWLYDKFQPPFLLFFTHIATFVIIIFASKERPYWHFHALLFIWIIFSFTGLIQKL